MKKDKEKGVTEQEAKAAEEAQRVRKAWHLPFNRYWLVLGAGVGLLGLAAWVGLLWLAAPDVLVIGVITIALFIGGALLVRRQVKRRHDIGGKAMVNIGQVAVGSNQVGRGFTPNSLNIYAAYDEDVGAVIPQRIAFENVYKPMGQPQHCLNTNRDYYIHIWDIGKGRLRPFVLADRKYTDPSILARYLGLPAQRKYLRNRESLMRLIGPGLLAVGVVIGFIAIIAVSG